MAHSQEFLPSSIIPENNLYNKTENVSDYSITPGKYNNRYKDYNMKINNSNTRNCNILY